MRSTVFKGTTIISRKEAKAKGLKRFFTGKPCKYGHISERFTSNYICVKCSDGRTPKLKEGKPKAKAEPELNYAQIGKAIMERMKQLESIAAESTDWQTEMKRLRAENKNALNKIKEQHDQIQKLNQRISQMNQASAKVPEGKFKLSEIARIK